MENKLATLKHLKTITLTTEERNLMRAHAARIVMTTPVVISDSFFKRGVQHGLRIALSSMLFVVFIAGSVSAVASNALPGDPLYSFKLNVNEKVKGLIVGTDPATQLAFKETRIKTRVGEIQTLASSNSLTQAKQEIAAKALSSQVADLSANLNTLSSQSPATALTVTASLTQTLKANKTTLENTPTTTAEGTTSKASALKTVDATLLKVSDQEVKIISNEIDSINKAVTTVLDSASGALQTTPPASTQTPAVKPPTIKPITPSAP
jgi:hypothetical protein